MRDMRKALQVLFPFAPGPSIHDAQLWGVWNRRQKCWAERPAFCREAAERIAAAMVDAYAAGWARDKPTSAARRDGLRFSATPHADHRESWGVWDRRNERWAERTLYDEEWAERIATALNEALAAGLTDAMIGKVRSRRRRSR